MIVISLFVAQFFELRNMKRFNKRKLQIEQIDKFLEDELIVITPKRNKVMSFVHKKFFNEEYKNSKSFCNLLDLCHL